MPIMKDHSYLDTSMWGSYLIPFTLVEKRETTWVITFWDDMAEEEVTKEVTLDRIWINDKPLSVAYNK